MQLTSLMSHFKGGFEFLPHRTKKALIERLPGKMAPVFGSGDPVSLTGYRHLPCALFCFLPRKGFFCFRAQEMACIFPSVPRTPNPPGTSTPLFKRAHHRRPLSTSPARNDQPKSHFQDTEAMKLLHTLCYWTTSVISGCQQAEWKH